MLSLVALGLEYVDGPLARWAAGFVAAHPGVHAFFQIVTQLGLSGWILVLTAFAATIVASRDLRSLPATQRPRHANWHGLSLFAFAAVAISGSLASLVKNTIGRARPKHLETLGPHHFDFAAFEASFASFPSGHATTIGALCAVLALVLPRWWPAWLVLAIVAGGSRVMVGAHYPSDVVAGLAFGALGTLMIAGWLARRRLLFRWREGEVLPRLRRPL